MTPPIAIGVSSCLLVEHVRYDGGHKRDRYITDALGAHFRLVLVENFIAHIFLYRRMKNAQKQSCFDNPQLKA